MSNAAVPATDGPDRSAGPLHVAIIMDGNGRWAAARGLPRAEGHRRGVEALRRVVRATHELGIGQHPWQLAKVVDAIYPMTYPSHYRSGEYNLDNPDAAPGTTVMYSLRDFRRQLEGGKALLVPWLQDFSLGRTYTLADVAAQIASARTEQTGGFMLWNAGGISTRQALRGGAPPPLPTVQVPQL